MLVIGLTGGIGSGKSAAAACFAKRNIPIIDTDQLSRDLTQPGTPALKAIADHFGSGFLLPAGTLDRTALRKHIFRQPEDRRWLEACLHPLIYQTVREAVASCTNAPYCIVVIPLLTEFPQNPLISRILVIDASPKTQLSRAKQRDTQAKETLSAILKSQSSREKRLQLADDVIYNEESLAALDQEVEKMHKFYLELSQHSKD